jgi:hypothetical protein
LNDSLLLDGALSTGNRVQIKRHFNSFRRKADDRFNQFDLARKKLCEDLRQVRDPLTMVLRGV